MIKENIILIGMPWSGKSTIGVLLAKSLHWNFIDTDLLIQSETGKLLQQIIDEQGVEQFRKIEEEYVLKIKPLQCVVATGGSVVYSHKAMEYLKQLGNIIYLKYPFEEINRRAKSVEERGLVRAKGQTLYDLYQERTPLYESWADIIIDCHHLNHEQVVDKILLSIKYI
ncbi:MAG TPA: shikimate kinase [Candidatus Hydrogenedens sp.]|mgnify:CR=1 FL=1|nr:shikimate kinase [Candidatus Hydrogenedens sp.]HOK09399.1 shikimate kinase [Candidatus Hydrogenedens sp.]HOL19112.1 shikimate kinase [Candidatus Hydrogenedens sp.]HPP58070.1 shikimate kinase [Candidatus Hydrogenedens sp.]